MSLLPAQLLVLAKSPRPGHAKTRLSPAYGAVGAAAVAQAALADTLTAVAAVPVARRVLVLDGPLPTLPSPGLDAFDVLPQCDGDLGDRLECAFADAASTSPLPLLLVGMDTPQVTPDLLADAVRALLADGTDAVLGLAEDGGWWALGLRVAAPGVFTSVPMSTPHTGRRQAERLAELHLRTTALPVLRDIDEPADLAAVLPLLPPDSALTTCISELRHDIAV